MKSEQGIHIDRMFALSADDKDYLTMLQVGKAFLVDQQAYVDGKPSKEFMRKKEEYFPIEKECVAAFRLVVIAAKEGKIPEAQYICAQFIESGILTYKNKKKAKEFYKLAEEGGFKPSCKSTNL